MGATSVRFVIAAYALTWVMLAAYAWYLHALLRRERETYHRSAGRAEETP